MSNLLNNIFKVFRAGADYINHDKRRDVTMLACCASAIVFSFVLPFIVFSGTSDLIQVIVGFLSVCFVGPLSFLLLSFLFGGLALKGQVK